MLKISGPLIAIFSVVISLGLGEIAIRCLAPQQLIYADQNIWKPDPKLGWRHVKNIDTLLNTGERTVRFATDEHGYRISPEQPPPTEPQLRILGIGDSFLEATQVENQETMLELLNSALSKQLGKSIKTVNAGVGGYDPNQYFLQTQEALKVGRFDLGIVFLYVDNDVVPARRNFINANDLGARHVFRLPKEFSWQELIDALFYPLNDLLETRSHLFVFLKTSLATTLGRLGLTAAYFPFGYRKDQAEDRAWQVTADICKEIGELFSARAVPAIFVLIPAPFQVHQAEFDNYATMFGLEPKELCLEQPNRILEHELKTRGLYVIDTLAALRQADQTGELLYGRISKHFSAAGHRVVAAELLPHATKTLKERDDTSPTHKQSLK
ncbi:MAG: hypothetical protein GX589_02670 [Deltaproteobacteria bacterium]|nr:hypothetical protein [Deltaproteobacteria bacterium]